MEYLEQYMEMGSKFLVIDDVHDPETVGTIVTLIKSKLDTYKDSWFFTMHVKEGRREAYYNVSDKYMRIIPVSLLTDRQLFTVKITGQLTGIPVQDHYQHMHNLSVEYINRELRRGHIR